MLKDLARSALIVLTTAVLLRWFSNRRELQKFASQRNALPVKSYPCGFLGLHFLYSMYHEAKANRLLKSYHARFEKYGNTWTTHVLGRTEIVTREPENIKAVLATQFSEFDMGVIRPTMLYPLLGKGIFAVSQGHGWEEARALLRPQFNRKQIINDLDSLDFHVNRLVGLLPPNEVFDIQPWFRRLTMDTATDFLFGESIESLRWEEGNSPEAKFHEAFNTATYWLAVKLRVASLAPYVGGKKFKEACEISRNFVTHFVDIALDPNFKATRAEKRQKEGEEKYVFLEALAESTSDREMITDQVLNLLLAGRDTTASSLSIAMWFLARNKDVWVKLREEVMREVGPSERPDWEKVKAMKYLRHVINETLRLFPIIPFNGRYARVRTTLPRGGGPDGTHPIVVEPGQKVVYSPYSMQRRTDIYGPDADRFIPERWDTLKPTWEYVPFSGGPRICLGQQFALMEASFVLVRIVQKFRDVIGVDPRTGKEVDGGWGKGGCSTEDFVEGLTLGLFVGDGVHLKFVPA